MTSPAQITARTTRAAALVAALAATAVGCVGDTEEIGGGGFLPGAADGFTVIDGAWPVERDWSDADEEGFSRWVETVGRNRAAGYCRVDTRAQRISLWSCLATPEVNPLHDERDEATYIFADCADTPYVLRAYYAYKHGLPFSYVAGTSGAPASLDNGVDYYLDWRDFDDFAQLVHDMAVFQVHAEMFRMPVDEEGDDSYPVRISRETVRPGSVFYDHRGHVLVVFAVEEDGTVRLMDGHPDNSLTVVTFGEQWPQGNDRTGGGFRAWRPQRLDPETGRFVRAPNAELAGYSGDDQFQPSYDVGGRSVGYHEWVRLTLCASGCDDAVGRFGELLGAVCNEIQARVDAVQASVDAGMSAAPHPDALPPNIYDASGEWMDWERFSTAGRDVRLRQTVRNLHAYALESYESVAAAEGAYEYTGTADELADEYLEMWQAAQHDPSCRIEYRSPAGQSVSLTVADVVDRLFDLSFDPFHCPELRWGAAAGELASCPDGEIKLAWYDRERRLRNILDRESWATTPVDLGPELAPDIHVGQLLADLATR